MRQQTGRLAAADQVPSAHPTRSPGGTGIAVASRSIAILKRSARFAAQRREERQAPKVREEHFPEISSSDAVKLAGRVLGGS